MIEVFNVTNKHIVLIKRMHFIWSFDGHGAPSVSVYEPYGFHSDSIYEAIAEVLDLTFPDVLDLEYERFKDMLYDLHKDTKIVLQILVDNLSLEVGTYRKEFEDGPWRLQL